MLHIDIADSFIKGKYLALIENLKKNKFVIVKFLNEMSVEVVPCNWLVADESEIQFNCHWPGSSNVFKLSATQKAPTRSWKLQLYIPRKFFR